MDINFQNVFGGWAVVFVVMFFLLTVAVHILFAVGVARDTGIVRDERGDTTLVGPITWVIATLLGGVVVAGIYWVIHHSTLRRWRVEEG